VVPSVPTTDGAPCTSDLACATGAFCSPGAGGANACHTSGLLQRGDIYYVAGTTLDLTMIVSACGRISDVLQGSAWQRLIPLGVTRHTEQLPSPTLPVGVLLARRGGGASGMPGPRLRVTPGCMIPPDSLDVTTAVPTRIAFGVNDLPSVGTEPPTSGKLDATVLIPDAGQSQVVFQSAARCPAEPAPSLHGVGLTNVGTATIGTAAAN
jgi:hypothetical protein